MASLILYGTVRDGTVDRSSSESDTSFADTIVQEIVKAAKTIYAVKSA